jgi:hypothetical protein
MGVGGGREAAGATGTLTAAVAATAPKNGKKQNMAVQNIQSLCEEVNEIGWRRKHPLPLAEKAVGGDHQRVPTAPTTRTI